MGSLSHMRMNPLKEETDPQSSLRNTGQALPLLGRRPRAHSAVPAGWVDKAVLILSFRLLPDCLTSLLDTYCFHDGKRS